MIQVPHIDFCTKKNQPCPACHPEHSASQHPYQQSTPGHIGPRDFMASMGNPRQVTDPWMNKEKNTASTIQDSWCKLWSWFKTRVHQWTHEIGHFGQCFNMFWPFIFGRWIILVYTLIPIDCWQFFPCLVNPLFYFSSCSFFLCGIAWSWKAWYVMIKTGSDDQPSKKFTGKWSTALMATDHYHWNVFVPIDCWQVVPFMKGKSSI
jgi:hypothetical protein